MYPVTYKTSTRTSYYARSHARTYARTYARTNVRKVYNVYIITISKPVNYFCCSFPYYYVIFLSASVCCLHLLRFSSASTECAVAQVPNSNSVWNEWIILNSSK